MIEQLTLALPEGVLFSAKELVIPPGLSPDQFLDVGRYLSKARGSVSYWIADWREAFRKAHGDDAVRAALAQLNFEGEDWRAVEKLNAAHERIDGLTLEHNFVLGTTKTDEDRKMWGELARKEKLSPRELQMSIRAGTVKRIESGKSGTPNIGVASIEAVSGAFTRYRAQVGDQYLAWKSDTREAVMAELLAIVEFYNELHDRHEEEAAASIAAPGSDAVRRLFAPGDNISVQRIQRRVRLGYQKAVALFDALVERGEIREGVLCAPGENQESASLPNAD